MEWIGLCFPFYADCIIVVRLAKTMNNQWCWVSALLSSYSEAQKIYTLYARDVEGAIISFRLFKNLLSSTNTETIPELIHHASCFICSARRSGRLLEALSASHRLFSTEVAEVIKLEWKKKRSFYEKLRPVRDAIEHIDSKDFNQTKLSFFNLENETLKVTENHSFPINQETLNKIVSSLETISKKIIESFDN